jgi:hypothetical protein
MVVAGKKILEMAGFDARLQHPQQLPSPTELDSADLNWRWKVIREAKKQGLEFTHGIAAKLINLYLMARFTNGGHADHPNVEALHPPIDSLLFNAFHRSRSTKDRLTVHWSTFDSRSYQRTISTLRRARKHAPLWTAESLWQGHR